MFGNHVLFDANIWYSRTLTDWFFKLHLASQEEGIPLFYPQWTEDILTEAHYHLRKNKPTAPSEAIDARFDRIRSILTNWRIANFDIINTDHPDHDDHHVINAALNGQTDYLITDDREFSTGLDLDQFPFEIMSSDEFLCLIFDSAPELCLKVARDELRYWSEKMRKDRSVSVNLPKSLRNAGCPDFAEKVRRLVLRINDGEYWTH